MTDIVDELRARALQGRFNLEAADEIERLRAELSEQCRLLGMSGEREAKHLAQIAALEKERDALRAKIETAENDTAHQKALAASALRVAKGWEDKCNELRAKIEAMEQQEPVAWCATDETGTVVEALGMNQSRRFDTALYLAPGAQPAQKAVAYLDLGVGGYMDIGTDLTDEQLASLPKGRHMLGIVGTYGVDGYVSAQPAPSIPEGWKLVSIEPTEEMYNAGANHCDGYWSTAQAVWDAMLAAAPEAKPCP